MLQKAATNAKKVYAPSNETSALAEKRGPKTLSLKDRSLLRVKRGLESRKPTQQKKDHAYARVITLGTLRHHAYIQKAPRHPSCGFSVGTSPPRLPRDFLLARIAIFPACVPRDFLLARNLIFPPEGPQDFLLAHSRPGTTNHFVRPCKFRLLSSCEASANSPQFIFNTSEEVGGTLEGGGGET